MSAPCQGIALKPVRLADIAAAAVAQAPTANKYVRPSDRAKTGPTPLTADELSSKTMFPTLGLTTKVASQMSYKKNVEDGIKKAQKDLEEGLRREQITDPSQMTAEELQKNGWANLSLIPNWERRQTFIDSLVDKNVLVTEDGPLILTPEIVADPVKLKFYTQIFNMDGTPIEREKETSYVEKPITYNPMGVKKAAERMWAFVGKKLA
jgi:hypothetical protein